LDTIFRYIKKTSNTNETVEYDVYVDGEYSTPCNVDVSMLLDGFHKYKCINGNEISLDDETSLSILKLIQKERRAVKYSGFVKTLDGWRESGYDLNIYLAVGDTVDEHLADEQLNVLPPLTMKNGYFQVGEPYNQEKDDDGNWHTTWCTFAKNGSMWTYCGLCFENETKNRVKERDGVEGAIQVILMKTK
jgi:hypothetical protein